MRAFIAFLTAVNYWHQRYPDQDVHDSSDSVGQNRPAEGNAYDQSPGYINSLPAPQPTRYEAPPLMSPTAPTSGGGHMFDLLNRRVGVDPAPARPTPAMPPPYAAGPLPPPSSYAATPPPPPPVYQYGGGGHDHPLGGQFNTVAPGPPQAGFLGYHPANPASAAVYGQPAPPPPYPASFVTSDRDSIWARSNWAKRHRRRPEEIERHYQCGWHGCDKGYDTLNHLNAHVTMKAHGEKRTPDDFKEIRKQLKERNRQRRQMMEDAEKAAAARRRWRHDDDDDIAGTPILAIAKAPRDVRICVEGQSLGFPRILWSRRSIAEAFGAEHQLCHLQYRGAVARPLLVVERTRTRSRARA
ncbi:hypothetical protein PG984_014167 [Apiospora sp. TS-2023a]